MYIHHNNTMLTDIFDDSSETANKMPEDGDIETLRKKHVVRGLSGIVNLGNSCYLNASLQCLEATDEFVAYIRGTGQHGKYKAYLKNNIIKRITEEEKKKKGVDVVLVDIEKQVRKIFKNELSYYLRNVTVVMWGVNCKHKPIAFKRKLGQIDDIYKGPVQNDAQECVNKILDVFHEETKSDVVIELRDVPEQLLQYSEMRNKYTELINAETTTNEEKIKIVDEFKEYKLTHLKEDAGLKAIEYWQKFIRKNHSVIVDLFYGLELSEVKCTECNNVNFTHTSYTSLAIQIPNKQQEKPANHWYGNNWAHWYTKHNSHGLNGPQIKQQTQIEEKTGEQSDDQSPENKKEVTLYECLDATFKVSEMLTGDNMLTCDICMQKRNVIKRTTLWHCPPRLIIHLKRFINVPIPNTYHTRQEKVEKLVKFPITGLDLKEYMSEYISGDCIYDLYAVIHQWGTLGGGHYVAYTKNLINGQWYYYNDDKVKRVKPEEVEEKLISPQAYVLFYEKRGNVDITSGFSSDEDDVDLA